MHLSRYTVRYFNVYATPFSLVMSIFVRNSSAHSNILTFSRFLQNTLFLFRWMMIEKKNERKFKQNVGVGEMENSACNMSWSSIWSMICGIHWNHMKWHRAKCVWHFFPPIFNKTKHVSINVFRFRVTFDIARFCTHFQFTIVIYTRNSNGMVLVIGVHGIWQQYRTNIKILFNSNRTHFCCCCLSYDFQFQTVQRYIGEC